MTSLARTRRVTPSFFMARLGLAADKPGLRLGLPRRTSGGGRSTESRESLGRTDSSDGCWSVQGFVAP